MEFGCGVGFRVTSRDVAVVRWIGRCRFALAGQVAGRFAMDERNAYRRLRGLVGLGLLEHRRVFHAQPGVYLATVAGLQTAAVELPRARVDIRTYRHDRIAVEVLVELEREFGRERLVTERELRSREGQGSEGLRYAVRLGGEATRRGLHFPDLAVESENGRPLVVEVELAVKGRARLESIVGAYVRGRHVGGVRCYAAPAARAAVGRAVSRASAGELFDLRPLEDLVDLGSEHRVAAA